jgi:hypothetical protein
VSGAVGETAEAIQQSPDRMRGYEQAADRVRAAGAEQVFYGNGFWSAPLVSLLADRPFRNIGQADVCALGPSTARLVWDEHAQAVFGPPEAAGRDDLVYTPDFATASVAVFRVGPPASCANDG